RSGRLGRYRNWGRLDVGQDRGPEGSAPGRHGRAVLAARPGPRTVLRVRHVVPAVRPDERVELARKYLAEARQRGVEQMPPTLLMREVAELRRLLGQVLAVLAERQDEGRQLAGVRAVPAAFDW